MRDDLKAFFMNPQDAKHRQYEALRAYVLEGTQAKEAAKRFGFTEKSLYALAHDLRAGKLDLFPKSATGPKGRRLTPYVRERICALRTKGLAAEDIARQLGEEEVAASPRTVERILKEEGFAKLKRRTDGQRGLSTKNTALPAPARNLDFDELEPFRASCQVAGLFCFLPYLIESGIMERLEDLPLPDSNCIGKKQAFLSLLALKLIGGKRLCHVRQYDHDTGFGLFAGLNVLPKPTYSGTYSCLVSAALCRNLQTKLVSAMADWDPDSFSATTINLDFHSVPHFGEQSQMEKVWCGARNKAMKGANTFFAQDAQSKALLYANADVLRGEGAEEVLRFVQYLRGIKGVVDETLVFDSRLTTYKVLGELDEAEIKFITLRIRSKSLEEQTEALGPEHWKKVRLPIPKRKRQVFLANESEVLLGDCARPFRQIIMKDHGRAQPTYVVTNNRELKLEEILTVYAQRWRIENTLAELVDFFNINALSSPLMARIHFDLLLTVVASFLYHRFAQNLPRFERCLAPEIFRSFIDTPGTVSYDGNSFDVRIRKRAHTPILLGVKKLQEAIAVPWLDGRDLKIHFTP